jgi:outer membrane translocation and assembly module TamA
VVPFFKRYFLGGSTSLRGWGRYEVAPLTDSGLPLGGLSLFEGSSEARYRLTSKLSAVAFVDFGGVGLEPWKPTPDGLRVDVGPGLRYQTPVGPVRVDFGYQLTPIDGLVVNGEEEQRHWRVHISIGQAF